MEKENQTDNENAEDLSPTSKGKKGSTSSLHKSLHVDQQALLNHPSYIELQEKLTQAEETATKNWENVLRLEADRKNMERRFELDLAKAHKFGIEKFVLELLPIIDSLERATEAHTDDPQFEGVNLTLKMFYSSLEKFGVETVDPLNEPFNPEWHQAISMQVNDKVKPGTVLSVFQKGYLLNKRLIRPAMVVVSKAS